MFGHSAIERKIRRIVVRAFYVFLAVVILLGIVEICAFVKMLSFPD
jgi:hypothetical protein